ncbi:MAG: M20/M25/M40 family metallo-hydrolase [Acidisphaera sp.]|nr:M20/M25/M40 family metallo-hydrolase [Acidisphaera sp.]
MLRRRIAEQRDELVRFLSELVRAPSPNPPGDTRAACAVLQRWLDAAGAPYRIVAPRPDAPNILGSFAGARPGPHLVLNGHFDTFPTAAADRWSHDPYGGEVAQGRVWGTGSSDMKQGTASLVALYGWLYAMRDQLAGRLTLTAVSDEETFGPHGARWLVEHHAEEVLGDCLLNAEPGAPTTVRFGEKSPLWLAIRVSTPGCHGAYTHKSASATKIAAAIIEALAELERIAVSLPGPIAEAIENGAAEIDAVHAAGAAATMGRVTLNIGGWNGGTLVNMLPGDCTVEADIRVPWGLSSESMIAAARDIVARFPEAELTVLSRQEPRWSDPTHPMVGHLRRNAEQIAGLLVRPIPSLAGTDARLWRECGVPAFTYGTTATNVAMPDEYTDIAEWLDVVAIQALSALDYLCDGEGS